MVGVVFSVFRCGEAVAVKAEDMHLNAEIPKIKVSGETAGARKSPGDIYVRKQHLKLLRGYVKNGITVTRRKKHKHGKGPGRMVEFKDTFKIPKTGYVFKSRANAGYGHLSYHAVYMAVRREAPKFLDHLKKQDKKWAPEVAKLRPHSGRATLITELMGEGVSMAMSMKYARHATGSVRVHLAYGRLTLKDVKAACDSLPTSRTRGKPTQWSKMTMGELLRAQKSIMKEIERRNLNNDK